MVRASNRSNFAASLTLCSLSTAKPSRKRFPHTPVTLLRGSKAEGKWFILRTAGTTFMKATITSHLSKSTKTVASKENCHKGRRFSLEAADLAIGGRKKLLNELIQLLGNLIPFTKTHEEGKNSILLNIPPYFH